MAPKKELNIRQKLLLEKILSTCSQRKKAPPKKNNLTLCEILKKKGHRGK